MIGNQFSEHIAKIRSDREVASFIKLFRLESWPSAINFSAAYGTAEHHHHISMTVIGATISVFFCGTAEFGHRHQDDIGHAISHVLRECGKGIAELLQQRS